MMHAVAAPSNSASFTIAQGFQLLCIAVLGLALATIVSFLYGLMWENPNVRAFLLRITRRTSLTIADMPQDEWDTIRTQENETSQRAQAPRTRPELFPTADREAPGPTSWSLSNAETDLRMLLLEMEINVRVKPAINGNWVLIQKREYRRLVEFCDFYFEEPITPQKLFEAYGLRMQVVR